LKVTSGDKSDLVWNQSFRSFQIN